MLSAIRASINWRAAIYAGIAAGLVASMVQIILWWVFWDALPSILYRDARLVAAIVLGAGVLPPPATFDWWVMLLATSIHFALSIVYSMMLIFFIAHCRLLFALLAGAIYGLALFGVNMYGFTIIFPWFEVARDWITIMTHAVFGVSVAGFYAFWGRV